MTVIFNRFRGGIVPLAQIEGNMQMMMYAMKVTKKGCCTNVCEGLVNFLTTSDLDVLEFLQRFHNSLFLFFLFDTISIAFDTFISMPAIFNASNTLNT